MGNWGEITPTWMSMDVGNDCYCSKLVLNLLKGLIAYLYRGYNPVTKYHGELFHPTYNWWLWEAHLVQPPKSQVFLIDARWFETCFIFLLLPG